VLGFEIPWSSEDLAYLRHGETSFLLQAFNVPGFVRNYQMHLLVKNADDWHAHVVASGRPRTLRRPGRHARRPAVGDAATSPCSIRAAFWWRIAQNIPRSET
jgi:hypothetical protein